jgi:membrane associated rhomboid family serine protease
VLYPSAPVTVLNPIFPLWFVFGIFWVFPAWLVVGEWFVWNLLSGVGALSMRSGEAQGGVAFFAHLGGFVGGLLMVRPLMLGRQKQSADRWHGFRPPPGNDWRSRGPRAGR